MSALTSLRCSPRVPLSCVRCSHSRSRARYRRAGFSSRPRRSSPAGNGPRARRCCGSARIGSRRPDASARARSGGASSTCRGVRSARQSPSRARCCCRTHLLAAVAGRARSWLARDGGPMCALEAPRQRRRGGARQRRSPLEGRPRRRDDRLPGARHARHAPVRRERRSRGNVLDALRAARQVAGSACSGRQARALRLLAGRRCRRLGRRAAATYAPELRLEGAVVGGVLGEPARLPNALFGNFWAGVAVFAVIGYDASTPSFGCATGSRRSVAMPSRRRAAPAWSPGSRSSTPSCVVHEGRPQSHRLGGVAGTPARERPRPGHPRHADLPVPRRVGSDAELQLSAAGARAGGVPAEHPSGSSPCESRALHRWPGRSRWRGTWLAARLRGATLAPGCAPATPAS